MTGRPIIEIEHLSKLYRLGTIGYGSLRTSASAWLARRRGGAVPVPFSGIHPAQAGPRPNTFWALRDFSATVREGEIVGVIGRNGAGKSTLLKLLSRITEPTAGRAVVHGTVGSMLEVGAGFHSELSGRDNIFLSGAILGMKKAEISRRLDEIIGFADIGAFIDTPVKRYSSGMYVRLAFAVTAHLEPDILLIDEVLAVGDAAFQKRCLGRMKDAAAEHGRTVLFVSHNLGAIQRLCERCLLLDRGRLQSAGDPRSMVAEYLSNGAATAIPGQWIDVAVVRREGSGEARFAAVRFGSGNPDAAGHPYSNGPLEIELAIDAERPVSVRSIAIGLRDGAGRRLLNADIGAFGQTVRLPPGRTIVRLRIEHLHLMPGTYGLALWMARYSGEYIGDRDVVDYVEKAMDVEVVDLARPGIRTAIGDTGIVTCEFSVLDISHPQALRDTILTGSI
ncbi:MAG: polysaccharide ABC transporter ATP-binding protein [Rhodothermales bacterium]